MRDIVERLRHGAEILLLERGGILEHTTLTEAADAIEARDAELERLRAENDALIAFLQKQGLLAYLEMCTRPDNTLGPAWVLHRVWAVDGDSCLGWHEDDPRAAAEVGMRLYQSIRAALSDQPAPPNTSNKP